MDKLEIVAELPDTEQYAESEGSNEYLELARLHQEYSIAWIIPAWITEEPRLALAKKDANECYALSEERIDQIIAEEQLDKESLLKLGFYTRYGGKIILALILGFMIYAVF